MRDARGQKLRHIRGRNTQSGGVQGSLHETLGVLEGTGPTLLFPWENLQLGAELADSLLQPRPPHAAPSQ